MRVCEIVAKIVSENFFGGFNKPGKAKNNGEAAAAAGADGEQPPENPTMMKNRKQWVDEMILKSKQIKYERQKERDKTLDLTEQLDKEWRTILPLMGNMAAQAKQAQEATERANAANGSNKPDEFDVLVRNLQFESKAHVK